MDRTDAGAPRAGALACVEDGAGAGEAGEAGAGEAAAGGGPAARGKRDYVRREYALKVAMVRRACRWIEAGRSVTDVCREPDMPLRSTFLAWLAAHPELLDMVEAARTQSAAVFAPRRAYHRWDAEVAAEVLARIEDGRGLAEVCAEPDMPVHQTVTRWLKERPEFAQAYRLAREAQADRLFDVAWRIACEAQADEVATARLKIQTLKWRVGRLAPRVYGPQKAVAAPAPGPAQADGEDGAGPPREMAIVAFHARSFAVTPERKVVETTGATQGMSRQESEQLWEDIRSGRISLEDLAVLNAAGEARMDEEAEAQDARRRARRQRR